MDKRDRAHLFRARLGTAMSQAGMSQSGLARAIDVNRSTVSQVLDGTAPRLPGGHIIGAMAEALGISSDWLLGLSDRPEQAQALVASSTALTPAQRALIDEEIFGWHRESEGFKIRHVPATLPDLMKTRAMLEWEYGSLLGGERVAAIDLAEDRISWMLSGRSDYEIALPIHELQVFAQASGYYTGIGVELRRMMIDHLIALHDSRYPTIRISLFDARQVYSAPMTIFGPRMAVLYVGSHHIAFRDKDRLRSMTAHFDGLVRAAIIQDRDLPGFLADLRP